MPTLPPSPFCSALAPAMGAETAAAPDLTDPQVAAAGNSPSVTVLLDAPTTAAAGANAAADFLDDTGDIHEIFHHARKLVANDHRFVLDEIAFMEAIEPPPLFLQRRA